MKSWSLVSLRFRKGLDCVTSDSLFCTRFFFAMIIGFLEKIQNASNACLTEISISAASAPHFMSESLLASLEKKVFMKSKRHGSWKFGKSHE